MTNMMNSSLVINNKTEAFSNFLPLFEKLQDLGDVGTHTNPSSSQSTLATRIGMQCQRWCYVAAGNCEINSWE